MFHGRSFARDEVISRLLVFDSFEDVCRETRASRHQKIKQRVVWWHYTSK
jgi:hypothetical protein